MAANGNLHRAKRAKNDEFYTQIHDIEDELVHYRDHFKDKVVLCNCDDPEWSMFWVFFFLQFADPLGLRKLIATHYDPERPSYKLEYDGTGEPVRTPLEGDGDFRSPECLALMDEADIVVTNPPFSLFREFVATLEEHRKRYLIIGSKNVITYKEIFPLIKENRLWIGYKHMSGSIWFATPEDYEDKNMKVIDGKKLVPIPCCWYTNMEHSRRNEELFLYRRYDPETYPHYDNYDAIEVGHVCDIPCDWDGVMGVPITFLGSYNPNQFEIVKFRKGDDGNDLRVNGKCPYFRILIRNRRPERPQEATEGVA